MTTARGIIKARIREAAERRLASHSCRCERCREVEAYAHGTTEEKRAALGFHAGAGETATVMGTQWVAPGGGATVDALLAQLGHATRDDHRYTNLALTGRELDERDTERMVSALQEMGVHIERSPDAVVPAPTVRRR